MAEKIKLWMDSDYELKIWSHDSESKEFKDVTHIDEISAYGLLLTALGECIASVLFSYSGHHGVDLSEFETVITYDRDYQKDCDNCEKDEKYDEMIKVWLSLKGDLSGKQREKLKKISQQCPIHKIFENGIHTEFDFEDA